MTLQAVFFDMGGTIETLYYTPQMRLEETPGIHQRLLTAGIDLPLDNAQLYEVISRGLANYHRWRLQSLEEIPPSRVWSEYIFADYPVDPAKLTPIAEELTYYIETHYYQRKMRPEIPAVLAAIRQMGLKIGLISNVSSRSQVPASLKKYGIQPYFEPVVLSSVYGRRKPDPAIFYHAARLAKVPTSACVHVGDRIARDISGARRAGFRLAIQIRHHESHGEEDTGPVPDAVIDQMGELVDILQAEIQKEAATPARKRTSSAVRALLFDAGDILYYRPDKEMRLAQFFRDIGLTPPQLPSGGKKNLARQVYQGLISQDQYRTALLSLYGVHQPDQVERGKRLLEEEDNNIRIFEGVKETLRALKAEGYLLGIITDTALPISLKLGWFERAGFGDVWDTFISSREIGVCKPDPLIYRAALSQLQVLPAEAVFVGHDTAELDGARAVGMKTVAINYNETAKADFYIQQLFELLSLPLGTPPLPADRLVEPAQPVSRIVNPAQSVGRIANPADENNPTYNPTNEAISGAETRPPTCEVSLSTMWAIGKFTSVKDFYRAAAQLGFPRIEINYQVDASMLDGMQQDGCLISSIHDPCPAELSPEELKKRDWLVSSTDESCRQAGVAVVKRTIDLAHALGAPVVVLHAGNVGVNTPLERELHDLYRAGRVHSPDYSALKARLVELRTGVAEERLAAVETSLRELLDYAGPRGVRLGLENRYHYLDIPLADEMGRLLDLAGDDRLGFIYDAGHAHTLDQLRLVSHVEWVTRYASRIIGSHLHDAVGIDDHAAPGLGEIDFSLAATHLPEGAFRTLELRRSNTPEQIQAGLRYLVEKGCLRCQ